jgi:hypothetical protein
MPSASEEEGQKTGGNGCVANDLHCALRVEPSLACNEHQRAKTKPGNGGDVPRKAQRLDCEIRAAEDRGKVGSSKEANENVRLTEN